MSNLDRSAVERFQNEPWPWEKGVEDRAAVGGLPPAYLQGFEPSIGTDGRLTLGSGVASVDGGRVSVEETLITFDMWEVDPVGSFEYHIYLDRNGLFHVDIQEPVYRPNLFHKCHPILGWRYIITIKLTTSKKVQWANSDNEVSAENLTFVASVGTQSNKNPEDGDVRAYLGKDPSGDQTSSDPVEISIEEYNGENWERRLTGGMRSGGSVADLFVSGFFEAGESVLSSPGLIWKERASGFGGSRVRGVAHGDGTFVAVGNDGKIGYSTDNGVTWTQVSSPGFGASPVFKAAYGNGTFVAVAASGKIGYSTDSVTWTQVSSSGFGFSNIYDIAYGDGTFVAVGADNKIGYSTNNGVTWTQASSPGFGGEAIRGIAYGNNVFVAVSENGKIGYSTDNGVTWTQVSSPGFGSSDIWCVAYGDGTFVAGAASGKIGYSTNDGVTWTQVSDPGFVAASVLGVGYGDGVFVAVGYAGVIQRSTNGGVTWGSKVYGGVEVSMPMDVTYLYDVAYSPTSKRWVTVGWDLGGPDGAIATSDWLEAGAGIVEQGSNSNGNYIVFSSGIQVCWGTYSATGFIVTDYNIGTYGYSIYQATDNAVPFSKAFDSTPWVYLGGSNTSGQSMVSYDADTISTTSFRSVVRDNANGDFDDMAYLAIGEAG